jgi:acyl-CoA synthetase (AMP-forming)/AMP-acid ligase II
MIDERGRIMITDRKKDLIVNDKGDNVAPQRVEGMLTLEPEIGQAMVAGDRRPHLVGLIEPDIQWMAEWAIANGVPRRARHAPGLQRALMAAVDRVNAGLSVTEKVRRILIADEPFSIENGEMTPSLKIRRHVIRALRRPAGRALQELDRIRPVPDQDLAFSYGVKSPSTQLPPSIPLTKSTIRAMSPRHNWVEGVRVTVLVKPVSQGQPLAKRFT